MREIPQLITKKTPAGHRYIEFFEQPGNHNAVSMSRFTNCYQDVARSFKAGLARFDSHMDIHGTNGPINIYFSGPMADTHCLDMGQVMSSRLNIGFAIQ